MKNEIPAKISFIKVERPILKSEQKKQSLYPFEKLEIDGNAMRIANRHIATIKSVIRTFLKTHPDFHLSVSERNKAVFVFRWKEKNELTIKHVSDSGFTKAGIPKKKPGRKPNKSEVNALLDATKPTTSNVRSIVAKERKTGSNIITTDRIQKLSAEGKTESEISSICNVSLATVRRALQVHRMSQLVD